MHNTRRSGHVTLITVMLFGIACACALFAASSLLHRPRVQGAPDFVGAISSGETAPARHTVDRHTTTASEPAYGAAAGEIPSDARIDATFDLPAVQRLDPDLRAALLKAQNAMRTGGIQLWITSGWRTSAYQQRLYDDAVAQHGVTYAKTHVATPEKSDHLKGGAVDIAPTAADDWLIRNGAQYGLCQTYANEIWHFELTAHNGQCPAQKEDALG